MELAPHIPIERCRLVKYNFINDVVDQELDNVSIYPIVIIYIFRTPSLSSFMGS